jgi:hypothetical protein
MSSTVDRPDTSLYTSLIHRRIGSHPRIIRHLLVFLFLTSLLLCFSAYTNLVTPEEQSMRVCLPVDLSRLSTTGHRAFSCLKSSVDIDNLINNHDNLTGMTEKTSFASETEGGFVPGKLAEFLEAQKARFLDDLRRGKRGGWTIAMGNEAGGEWGG